MPLAADVAGTAALAIVESLLLALNDRNVMPEAAIVEILKAAALSLEGHPDGSKAHKEAATLIHTIVAGRNSVRRP